MFWWRFPLCNLRIRVISWTTIKKTIRSVCDFCPACLCKREISDRNLRLCLPNSHLFFAMRKESRAYFLPFLLRIIGFPFIPYRTATSPIIHVPGLKTASLQVTGFGSLCRNAGSWYGNAFQKYLRFCCILAWYPGGKYNLLGDQKDLLKVVQSDVDVNFSTKLYVRTLLFTKGCMSKRNSSLRIGVDIN